MHALRLAALSMLLVALPGCQKKKDQSGKAADNGESAKEVATPGVGAAPALGLKAVPLPGEMVPAPWLADATKVVAFAGEAGPVIVAGGPGWLRWFDKEGTRLGEHKAPGAAQVLEAIDLDGDGISEILIGRGMGVGAADAPMSLEILYGLQGASGPRVETVALPTSTRAQVVAVATATGSMGELWAASFVNKYEVQVSRYHKGEDGSWSEVESRGRHRVVGDLAVMPDGTPVIARFYGDSADEDGGVYALPAEGEPIALPSTRGARALLALPGPAFQLAMADGWHKEYGKKAQGLISVIVKAERGYSQLASVQVKGNYGYSQLRLSYVHRDPGPELLASGNGNAVVILPTRPDLLFELAGAEALDAFPVQLSGDPRMEVVIAGPTPAIWTPR